MRERYPSSVWTTPVVILVALGWAAMRMAVSREDFFPITFILPMLVCVWTRRRAHLWGMAGVFTAMLLAKVLWVLPPGSLGDSSTSLAFAATLLNIGVGAIVIHLILQMRDRQDRDQERILQQNTQLRQQAEELQQQNEEIKAQTEELLQQNSEIESQAEELERQNQELQEANERLATREEVLQAAVDCTRHAGGARAALERVCGRILEIMGSPAEVAGVLQHTEGLLRCRVQAAVHPTGRLPDVWPLEGSFAQVVLQKDHTAYVDDLQRRPDLSAPFDSAGRYRSALATPLRIAGRPAGIFVLCSQNPSHWTQEQFRLIEWAAAQVAPLLESLDWQDALQMRAASVEAASKAKDEFLAMLSHELRTPLTPVLAAASELEHDPRLPADVRAEIAMIQRNVAVQSRLIDDLLDLTRIGRGKLDLNLQPVAVASLLGDAAAIVAADLDAHEQELEVDLRLPAGCAVEGDGARLQQVFWNLLKNAIKFSPRGTRVEMEAEVRQTGDDGSAPRLFVRIRDHGVGIEPSDLDRIFQPFEQAAALRRGGSAGGLGLGLSIARAIVEMHHGSLTAASEGLGRGSTFIVELPLSAEPAPTGSRSPLPEAARAADRKDGSALRILLVEDHRDTGMVMARLLRRSGYHVVHAQSVADAVHATREDNFDLLVSDLGLPDGSGLELIKQLRTDQPSIRGICMSGFGMESDIEASRAAGFEEHLIKPVDMQQLHAAIRRVAVASGTAGAS